MSYPYSLKTIGRPGLAVVLFMLSGFAAQAQTVLPLPPPPVIIWPEAEPERWTQEDVTLEQRFDTARKETLAAHQEALNDCQTLLATERPDCSRQAKGQLELELAQLKARARFGFEPRD